MGSAGTTGGGGGTAGGGGGGGGGGGRGGTTRGTTGSGALVPVSQPLGWPGKEIWEEDGK